MKHTATAILAGLLLASAAPAPAATTTDISSQFGQFTPNAITLHVGETTTLRLTSTEGTHYLKSDDLGIPMTTISPGSVQTVAITPKKAGTYVLHCMMYCGPGHQYMTITVTVLP
jgi:cytochrome c oxidase subunit 2